jgi:UDP:flavonoid glycosyltransferase YjiC (YdhE family)
MAKALGKEKADAYLATMLETDKKTEAMLASMAQPGGELSKMASGSQAQTASRLHDLEARLNALTPAQRDAPAFVYQSADGLFPIGQLVPAGTPGSVAVVYPNPDFFDRSLPAWEAQSLCVTVSTGPVSQQHFLYPTIVNIWKSLDWDALAQVLK